MSRITQILFLATVVALVSCEQGPGKLEDIISGTMVPAVNPYEKAPLSGLIRFRTEDPVEVEIEIHGPIPIKKTFSGYNSVHEIPVLGLYPDTTNLVRIKLTSESGKSYFGEVEMTTSALPEFLPEINVTKLERSRMEPGLHLAEMLIANNGRFHAYTLMFDDNGVIRWYLDMSHVGQIAYSALRLQNGNWQYLSWIDLYEMSSVGEVIRRQQMFNYAGNHHINELSNGNLLIGGSGKDARVVRGDGSQVVTRYDWIVEWDKVQNRPVDAWDLGQVLDIDRLVFPADYGLDVNADWFHLNNVQQDVRDNTFIASGRNQGVVKIDRDNNLKWILAPHKGWGKAGREGKGFETSEYLLTALDENGEPFPETIQLGEAGTENFEWSTGQHSPTILENGNLLLFDNGLSRNFQKTPTYSRAVEYKIDEENRTIQQVWQYGKERGLNMYSPITSDVDVLPNTGNRLITAGNIRTAEVPHAKMIEITHPGNEVVFEAEIHFKDALGTGAQVWAQFDLVYRGERYSLYP